MNQKIVAALIVTAVAASIVAGVVAVTYILQTSNAVDVTVTSGTINMAVTLGSSASTIQDTQTLTLIATVTDNHANGMEIKFYDNGTQIGATQTIVSLQASITIPALTLSEGVHSFTAGP